MVFAGASPSERRKKLFPLSRLFPNFVTLMAMCIGLSSLRFALAEKWELAAGAIIIAAVLDGMDGRLARLLKATSDFGAQLDSLADFVNFGVAPALLMYLWTLETLNRQGWAIALLYVVCCAIRLARFNSSIGEDKPAWAEKFFVGLAAPMGASLSLLFMIISFEWTEQTWLTSPYLNGAYMLTIALLMASRIPTFSIKKIIVKQENVVGIMIGAAAVFVLLTIEPWLTLLVVGLGYMASILLSSMVFMHYQHKQNKGERGKEKPVAKAPKA